MAANKTTDTKNFFEVDDEETLRYLISSDDSAGGGESISSRLDTFATRFLRDNDKATSTSQSQYQWTAFIDSTRRLGFSLEESLNNTPSSSTAESSEPFPSAFETDDGKLHLKATAALLNVSERRAVQLTLSSLSNLNEATSTNLQALLGTRSLLKKVMEYYFKQRVARLCVIAECLRKEQEDVSGDDDDNNDDDNYHASIVQAMDSLDATYSMQGLDRGLFRFLVSISCQTTVDHDNNNYTPSREQLLPSKQLRSDTPISLQESFVQRSPESVEWHQFIADYTDANRKRIHQERIQAMEALVVLLYHRIQGGVHRVDLMILLQAFQSSNAFFTAYPGNDTNDDGERLSQLAGLVCAECMGLWRVFDDADHADEGADNWTISHPLLLGFFPSSDSISARSAAQAETELEAIRNTLLKYSSYTSEDRAASPESLALLSFGLLFILAYNTILASSQGSDEAGYWQIAGTKGLEMAELAGDKYAALDYLNSIMENIVSNPPLELGDGQQFGSIPYDWLFFGDVKMSPMAICGDEPGAPEMDAASLTYASIGHEVLSALSLAFQDSILSVHHANACQNIAMVCELAAVIYRNSPTLCEPFWVDWALTTSATPPTKIPPMCSVMDSAFLLVSNALRVDQESGLSKEQLLATLAPLMRLVSSVCYNPENVEAAFGVIPPALLHKALLFCAADDQPDDASFFQNKWSVLDSFAKIARVGDSIACRTIIRDALCDGGKMSGPGVLLKVLSKSDDYSYDLVLHISSDLLKEAPVEWAMGFAQGLQMPAFSKVAEGKPVGLPFSLLYNGLVSNMASVVFSQYCGDTEAETYLNVIWRGVLKMSPVLPLSLSNVARDPIPVRTLKAIISFFGALLENIGAIMLLHKSVTVQTTARGIRDALIEMLALNSSFGESVMYYALLPVSLSIGASVEQYAQERSIIKFAAMAEDSDRSKYGLWHSTATRNFESETKDASDMSHVSGLVASADIDLDDLIGVVKVALNLLKQWSSHVEDIVVGRASNGDAEPLDNEQKARLLSLSPSNYLTMAATIPHSIRGKDRVLSLWSCASPTNFQFMIRYLDSTDGSVSWPLSLSAFALDVIHACVAHVTIGCPQESVVDTALFRAILTSPNFFDSITKLPARAFRSITEDASDGGSDDETRSSKILGTLALRLFCGIADTGAPFVSDKVPLGSLIDDSFREIYAAGESLYQTRETAGGSPTFLKDDVLLEKMQLATSSIGFLRALWAKEAAAPVLQGKDTDHGIKKYIGDESATFTLLSKIVLQHARLGTPESEDAAATATEGKCVLFSFLAVTVDFLQLATNFCLNNDAGVDGSMMTIWDENYVEIMSMAKNFCSIESCFGVAAAIKELSSIPNPTAVLQLFPITAASDFPGCFSVDISAASILLSSLDGAKSAAEDLSGKVYSLALSHHLLACQLILLDRWRHFSEKLLNFPRPSRLGSNATQESSITEKRSITVLHCGLAHLQALQGNIASIETAQTTGVDVRSFYDIGSMAGIIANLVLRFVTKDVENNVGGRSPDLLVRVLDLVSISTVKIYQLLESNVEKCCDVEQQLLASSIAILDVLESGGVAFSAVQTHKMYNIVSHLVRTTSQLLKLVEARVGGLDGKNDCLRTCLVLLSVLAAKSLEANAYLGGKGAFRSALCKTFEELDVVSTLVRQGSLFCSSAFEMQRIRGDSTEVTEAEESAIAILGSIFSLFCVLSQAGDMLPLLSSTRAFEMFTRNPLFGRAGKLWRPSNPLRGYVPTREKVRPQGPLENNTAFNAGKAAPVHGLWQQVLQCCKSALSSSRRDAAVSSADKERLQASMSDFIATHSPMMLSALKKIQTSSFTKNSLAEASLILSLLSEFCKRPCLDRRAHQAICKEFVPAAVSLAARIGSFLGASASSREFFNAVADIDEASDSEIEVGPRTPPFGRVQNARHEAIRYSHYASRFSTAVTQEDFVTSSHARSTDDLRSASGLESHGKANMTCEFERAIENAAASCMFFALTLIWETHPANSCFVMFSDAEASRIDAMSLVQPGTVVAFSSDRDSQRTVRSGAFPKSLHFGEVMHCNTLDRAWYARNLSSQGSEIVEERQLVGLEDASKRRCVLSYTPAPDTATELETLAQSASVGHLILGLRWCAEVHTWEARSTFQPLVMRLAELLAALLGTELSIHAHIGSCLSKSKESLEKLNAQLLDLFRDKSDGDDCTDGRLWGVLGDSCWESIRQQLGHELKQAMELEKARNAKNDAEDSGIFFGAVGRSSNRNPFDEMRMDYD